MIFENHISPVHSHIVKVCRIYILNLILSVI